MSLNKENLINNFRVIFSSYPPSTEDLSNKIAQTILDYSKDAAIDYVPTAGQDTNGVLDPSFDLSTISEMKISNFEPIELYFNDFKQSLLKNFELNLNAKKNSEVSWQIANSALVEYVKKFNKFKSTDEYESSGSVTPGNIDLSNCFDSNKSKSVEDISNNLANEIHDFFISSVFTSTSYNKLETFNGVPGIYKSNLK
jgi:hypothetical protein